MSMILVSLLIFASIGALLFNKRRIGLGLLSLIFALILFIGDRIIPQMVEADTMANELREIGVPETDVVLESKSNNTFQNA